MNRTTHGPWPIAVLLSAVLLGGCPSSDPPLTSISADTRGFDALRAPATPKAIIFDGTIPAPDGEVIGITVYQPALAADQPAPLILHGHGFGLARTRNFEGDNPIGRFLSADVSGDTATAAWNAGYYVISFDQRGFGQSSGPITVMDPDVDGRNISAILDWAESNLAHLARRNSDPLVGSVGLSYGGGFQLIGSAVDARFDALVPVATWNDLRYSLAPNGVPKTIWLDILVVGAAPGGFQFVPFVYTAFLQATLGQVSSQSLAEFERRSFASFCAGTRVDGRGVPEVDAFFIQGANDVLFNLNEAVANQACLRAAGRDARLLVQTDGHIVPLLQSAGRQILFGTDAQVGCGARVYDTAAMMLDFLDQKLMGRAPGPQSPPQTCIALGDGQGLDLPGMPFGGAARSFDATPVIPGGAGLVVELLRGLPLQTLLSTLAGLGPEVLDVVLAVVRSPPGSVQEGTQAFIDLLPQIVNLLPSELVQQLVAAPVYIPLHAAGAGQALAGIPQATLSFSGGAGAPPLFVGIGLRRGGTGDVQTVSEQVLPVLARGEQTLDLIGVRTRLQAGDELGLVIFGFHPYYANNSLLSLAPVPVQVSGTVNLPILVR